ncbi:MAG: aldo/keto reductase [Nevskia sp.]|nr:aldo/keto reductase [Nevskia sp.]
MRYAKLGNTALLVSELCLGTMSLGEGGIRRSRTAQQAEADRIVGRALEAGINFIDATCIDPAGHAELAAGRALTKLRLPRDRVVVATTARGGNRAAGSAAAWRGVMNGVKASLRRLRLDYIDLYQFHRFDPATPLEETMHALDALVERGHVRYVGVSDQAARQIMQALGIPAWLGRTRFESVQACYGAARRDPAGEFIAMLRGEKLRLVAAPTAAGPARLDSLPAGPGPARERADAWRRIAQGKGVLLEQLALAWLLHQEGVGSIIVGAGHLGQLDDSIAATNIRLTAEELAVLGEAGTLPAGYPDRGLDPAGPNRRVQPTEFAA